GERRHVALAIDDADLAQLLLLVVVGERLDDLLGRLAFGEEIKSAGPVGDIREALRGDRTGAGFGPRPDRTSGQQLLRRADAPFLLVRVVGDDGKRVDLRIARQRQIGPPRRQEDNGEKDNAHQAKAGAEIHEGVSLGIINHCRDYSREASASSTNWDQVSNSRRCSRRSDSGAKPVAAIAASRGVTAGDSSSSKCTTP